MKSQLLTEKVELYCDCPYCGAFNSDEYNQSKITTDRWVCDSCGKTFYVKED